MCLIAWIIPFWSSWSLNIQWVKGQIAADIGKEGCLFKIFMHIVYMTCTCSYLPKYHMQPTGTMLIIAYLKLFSFVPTFALRKWRVMKWHKTCLHEYVRRSERANVELFGAYCRLSKDLHLVWTNFLSFGQKCLATPPKRTPIDSCTSNRALTNMNWLCCTIISHTLQLTIHTQDVTM